MPTATKVRASHLLVASEEEARQLRQEIQDGASFASVAERVSKCPSGKQGGDLGFLAGVKWCRNSIRRPSRSLSANCPNPLKPSSAGTCWW